MTVYVESNFVLEIALGQKEAAAAESILVYAEQREIVLAMPSFALFEPFTTVRHHWQRRNRLLTQLGDEVRELKRSEPHRTDLLELAPMPSVFTGIQEREAGSIRFTTRRLFAVASVIEIDASVFAEALRLERDFGFRQMQDAIICAAIIGHLHHGRNLPPHYFATKNASDFSHPEIAEAFTSFGCAVVPTFTQCAQRLRINQPSPPNP